MIRIDLTKDTFKSPKHKYSILPLHMCYERLKRFRNDQSKVFYGVALEDIITFVFNLWHTMSTGDDVSFKTAYMDIHEQLSVFCKPLEGKRVKDLMENSMDDVYTMCTYFIVNEDEDITKYDDRIAAEKIHDWKAHFSWFDFFFLVQQQSKELKIQLKDTIQKTT